jgi:hypothetical protein
MNFSNSMFFIYSLVAFFLLSACGGGGGNNSAPPTPIANGNNDDWSISTDLIFDGGPGRDGIPSLDDPNFVNIDAVTIMEPQDLIIGIKVGDVVKGYPHKIMDWHEVTNDIIADQPYVLSYCPLTGSAIAWDIDSNTGETFFGVSGLLYNSNLIMFDRLTGSNWPQMLMQSAQGTRRGATASNLPLFEMTWESFTNAYPEALVLDQNTGFSRNYLDYPYGSYVTDSGLLFEVGNLDGRLHPKQRVLGIQAGQETRAYQISKFTADVEIINDTLGGTDIVVIGSAQSRLGVAFNRQSSVDNKVLTFTPIFNQLPIAMEDDEGNQWDINGKAVSGVRLEEQLDTLFSYDAYWFAWVAFFPQTSLVN